MATILDASWFQIAVTLFAIAYLVLATLRLITRRRELRIVEQQTQKTSEVVASNKLLYESQKEFLARFGENATSSIEWSHEVQNRITENVGKMEAREARLAEVLGRVEALIDKLETSES